MPLLLHTLTLRPKCCVLQVCIGQPGDNVAKFLVDRTQLKFRITKKLSDDLEVAVMRYMFQGFVCVRQMQEMSPKRRVSTAN